MAIDKIVIKCFEVPTKTPERDGTLEWQGTILVTVEVSEGKIKGLGYTYADLSTAQFITEHGVPEISGMPSEDNLLIVENIKRKCRNLGNAGVN